MNKENEVDYDDRTLKDWVRRAFAGKIAITDFQRSFVWRNDKAANYIKAIIEGKPVGLYLILKKNIPPQFKPRSFNKINVSLEHVDELVLDGQQRLTSLLHALSDQSEKKFFIQLVDIAAESLEVEDVISEGMKARGEDSPAENYLNNRIPMSVLRDETDEHGLTPLAHWCIAIGEEEVGAGESRVLESKIKRFIDENFFDRRIWACWLPKSFSRNLATEIFVETNTSSVRIKRFDIEVANARGRHDEDLRNSIQEAYGKSENVVLRHYFKEDPEDWIPDIGEWLLKVACLREGYAPREKNYEHAIGLIYRRKKGEHFPELDSLFADLVWVLEIVAKLGGATRRTLPSWPPVHVLAALHPELSKLKNPVKKNSARKLYEAYYWRSLFSNRYDVQANDRLKTDYDCLKSAIKQIQEKGRWNTIIPAFDDKDHPLYDSEHLLRHSGWIGTTSRLGRALASVAMSKQPADWITGDTLDPNMMRQLERQGYLERHHIFPRYVLNKSGEGRDRVYNGLNGVFLDGSTNRQLAKFSPEIYLKKIVDNSPITQDELRSRIEQYCVPYDEMKKNGDIRERYNKFLKKRAKIFANQIQKLGEIPEM